VQVTATGPSLSSVAVAVKVTAAPNGLVASTTRSAGRLSTGGVESVTTTGMGPWRIVPAPAMAGSGGAVAARGTAGVPTAKPLPEAGVHDIEPQSGGVVDDGGDGVQVNGSALVPSTGRSR